MLLCDYCNRSFSTKHSLSTHRYNFHRDMKSKSNDDQPGSKSKANEDQGIDEFDSTKHQECNNSQNGKNSEIVELKQSNSGKSQQTDNSKNSNQVDQLLPKNNVIVNNRKRNYSGKVKHCKRARQGKTERAHIRCSINDKLQRDHEVFSLLDAHVFKNEYCSKLATDYFVNEDEMKHTLPTNEFWLIDAVCKSGDLETVRKLVYENLDLIQQTLSRTNSKKVDVFD